MFMKKLIHRDDFYYLYVCKIYLNLISVSIGLLLLPIRLFLVHNGLLDYLPLVIAMQITFAYILLSYLNSSKIELVACF